MSQKLVCLISIAVLLSLAGNVLAQDYKDWDDGEFADHLWSSPANWAPDGLPTMIGDNGNRTRIEPGSGGGDYPILDSTIFDVDPNGAFVDRLYVGHKQGDGSSAKLWVQDGAKLTIGDDLNIGYDDGSHGICYVSDPNTVIEVWDGMKVGRRGDGRLMMNGGTINVGGTIEIPSNTSTASINIGHLQLNGGTITCAQFTMRPLNSGVIGTGTMDVREGTFIINGDAIATIQGYIDDGWITAYNGYGVLQLDYDVTNPGKTTLTAVHKLNPNPAHRAIVKAGEVELSWTLPDPCVPGQPVLVDVYFTDDYDALLNFTDPEAIRIVSKQNVASVVVQTQTKTRYFWAVDTYIGSDNDPILGPIFSFLADNAPPIVNAGPDISTILQDGKRTGPVSGIVTDDGAIQPYTVMWSVVEQPSDADSTLPGAVIADPTAEQTTVTVFAEGTYVLQLEAYDGEYTGSDTMTINVHPDDWTNRASGP